eukprot:gene7620-8422_t
MPVDNDLHKAAHKGDLEACKAIIAAAATSEEPINVNDPGASDRRALHRAAGAGHLELCQYFLEIGAEVDAVDKSGRTALHWAAISGHSEIVKLLMSKGANLLATTNLKTNSLHLAVEANRVETVRVLMQFASEDPEKKTALTMAKNSDDKTPWDISFGAKNKAICQVLKDMGDANGASSSCTVC